MIKKISDQDQKDWKKFINSSEKLENKDKTTIKIKKNFNYKSIDLHGHTLENANKAISDFIDKCYLDNVEKIKVITGKGSRSKNKQDPYLSTDLSILKYSVPDYIKNLSPYINKGNFKKFVVLFETSQNYIQQNANKKMLLTEIVIKTKRLLSISKN